MSDPVFTLIATNPFGLSNVGSVASPTFVDIDGDGDLDAFIGNLFGNTLFFENTGTASNPVFAAASTNPFGLSNAGWVANLTFADIDGDGDLDAFGGDLYGNSYFFKNTGTVNNPSFAPYSINPYGWTNVGAYANPTLVDIDGDGDLDAFIGNNYSDTLFYRNTGTASNPVFAAGIWNPFGLTFGGNSLDTVVFIDIDGDGDLDELFGWDADIVFVENTGTASNPLFSSTPIINPFGLSGAVGSPVFKISPLRILMAMVI
jgi:hypothetical protein